MGRFIISCDQATTICDKNQYGEATFTDKFKLMFHFMICKICKQYTKQNGIMSRVFGSYAKTQECGKQKCMTIEEKQKMEKCVKEKIN